MQPVSLLTPAQAIASAGAGQSGAGSADFGAFDRMRPEPPPADTALPGHTTPTDEATKSPKPAQPASTSAATQPHTAAEGELLHRLVALNTRRAAEEAAGTIRW